MESGSNENVIEFLKDAKTATLTFTQKRYITRIKKLSEMYPDECEVLVENKDRSILAHVPVSWVKVSPPRQVEMTDERRQELADRLAALRAKRESTQENLT